MLTDFGRTIFGYADEIFSLGRELMDAAKTQGEGRPRRLVVGVADVLPKLIVYRLLEPALKLGLELMWTGLIAGTIAYVAHRIRESMR